MTLERLLRVNEENKALQAEMLQRQYVNLRRNAIRLACISASFQVVLCAHLQHSKPLTKSRSRTGNRKIRKQLEEERLQAAQAAKLAAVKKETPSAPSIASTSPTADEDRTLAASEGHL